MSSTQNRGSIDLGREGTVYYSCVHAVGSFNLLTEAENREK